MFLRKLFSSKNKFAWVLIDLVIVIIGVYSAFLIQSYSQAQKNKNDQERVLTALKIELEYFRYRMFETSMGMRADVREFEATRANSSYTDFSDYRFIEPQYDYQTIQYALNLQNSELVDFELYNALQSLFVEIKKVEHVERLLTETSRRYETIPEGLKKTSEQYIIMDARNKDNFTRFITSIRDRGQISGRISVASQDALQLINSLLGAEKTKEVERKILFDNAQYFETEESAVQLGMRMFPNFTEEEIRSIYQEWEKSKESNK